METLGIGPDKAMHFLVSFVIALYDPLLSFFAGLGKEVYDELFGTGFNWGDMVANGMGILFALPYR